ncbi:MAG: hypothetical protein J6N49_01660 [Alphaproteobacteria bacterium]|nr:hypothetical protein [Alphaproteobacteria bacterium]
MLNLTKQSLSADSEVLNLNSNSVFTDNKKSHPCECEDLGRIILSSRDSRACGSRMTGKNIGSRMTSLCLQSGRSMIEMLGVLAIIGVLSVGGIAGYSKAMMQYKINKATDQITQIVGSIRTLYGSQKVYSGVWDKNVWKKAHLFPDEMWNTDKTNVENPFGGDVILETADRKNGASKAFSLRYTGLPEEACMALSTYDWGSSSSSGLISISVTAGCGMGNSDYDTDACPSDDWTFCAARKEIPISVARAAARCECPGDTCDISLKFY